MTEEMERQSLAQVGLETMALFAKAKAKAPSLALPGPSPIAPIAAEADRFELWAVNLGLFVAGHGSLDYRVREAESISGTLHRFMISLNEALAEVLEYGGDTDAVINTERRSSADIANIEILDEGSDSDSDLLLDGIKDPIDRLYKMATMICTPSSRFGSSKALRYEKVDPETGVNLLDTFAHFDYDYVSSLFLEYRKARAKDEVSPSQPESVEEGNEGDNVWEPIQTVLTQHKAEIKNKAESFLVSRIARANACRRQQFEYWKRHQEKLHQHSQAVTEGLLPSIEQRAIQVGDEPGVNRKAHTMELRPLVAPAPTITTATNLNVQHLTIHDDRTEVTVSEYALSLWEPGKEMIDFPPAPTLSPTDKFFECPYCFIMCSRALSQPKAWRAHLLHDLRPYICTYKDCSQGDQMYDRRQDWIQHEITFHRGVFHCPEHPDLTYDTTEELRDHLSHDHRDFNSDVSDTAISLASFSIPTNPARPCPICFLSLPTALELQNHIALHLERMALFSLPRSGQREDDDGKEGDSQEANIVFGDSREGDFDDDHDNEARVESPARSLYKAEPELGTSIPIPEEESGVGINPEPEYTIGIIYRDDSVAEVLSKVFDVTHETVKHGNLFVFERFQMIEHHVVAFRLLRRHLDEVPGRDVLISAFPSIRFIFTVSTAGGAPQAVRLGDVVVHDGATAWWDDTSGEVSMDIRRGPRIPTKVRQLFDRLNQLSSSRRLNDTMEASSAAVGTFGRPPSSEDRLFEADYEHVGGSDCTRCDPAKLVHREPKAPDVHFGVIAIGPRLRDGTVRDELNKTMQAISFDSELWIEQVEYPCINVRGIADYADSHPTDKQWNQHAAARAMAFVYMVLKRLSLEAVEQIPTARSVLEHEEEEERKRIDELRFGKQRSQGLSGRAGYN